MAMGPDSAGTPLLDVLSQHLPTELRSLLEAFKSSQSRLNLETLLRFAVGGECPTTLSREVHQEWTRNQSAVAKAIEELTGLKGSRKRGRESEDVEESSASSKRLKTGSHDSPAEEADDPPFFTLPSISTVSPIRKKVDITIHQRSIRFVNPASRVVEASIPLLHTSLSRAFLLPTRGKSKGHWTVVLLPTDIPEKSKTLSPTSTPQIIFGLDALSTTKFETTSYTSSSGSSIGSALPPTSTTVAKGEETITAIRKFLSFLPIPFLEPSAIVFRSACATPKSGHSAAGVDAYLSAKAGTLWFFENGILWGESKPCEYWDVSDLSSKDAVRLISATGRTCSVILRRKGHEPKGADKNDENEHENGVDVEEDIIETEFAMVDGREQDPISAWTRQRKHLFGKEVSSSSEPPSVSKQAQTSRKGKEVYRGQIPGTAVNGPAWDESDPEDEDFEISSSEDVDESSSSSDSDSDSGDSTREDGGNVEDGNESEDVGQSGSDDDDDEEEDDEESEEEELREEHHPLLRPGAMPRMSKAAIDAVVDMVNGDLIDDGSVEEDELED
ncbi:hypothetical protein F5I97DRAFT_313793 [Phlebopus sp. FC_14]|nr:hypothetical protein F5I97DRAFT_313793 [Phlebopus sp. FC_14]